MTEGPLHQHEKPMCVRIWLEVGHACEPQHSVSGQALALDWRVWVRGARGDISSFVHKVVFKLNPPSAFVYPRRVLQEPPYEIKESGCTSIDIPIQVYLKHTNKPKKIRLRYSLHIESNNKTNSQSKCVYYDIENPAEPLRRALLEGGGEILARPGKISYSNNKIIVIISNHDKAQQKKTIKAKRYKFIEPISCKHESKKKKKELVHVAVCPKCGDSVDTDLRKQLQTASMTKDEINHISQLYLSYSTYEKSKSALILPPLSDPIYQLPVLPLSLRDALESVETHYTM